MLTEVDARSLAQKVVDAAKATAHVDTGALRRSISFTYVKGEIIFRQLFYGVYHDNSKLEQYARQYIPVGQPWKVLLTKFGGEIVEVSRTKAGRTIKREIQPWNAVNTTTNIRKLIEQANARRKKREAEAEENDG